MNCQEFLRFIEAMPLRERTPAQMEEIRQHSDQCLSCAKRMLTASTVEHELSRLALVSPPVDLSASVMRRLRSAPSVPPAPARPHTTGFFWWVAGSMAALIAIAVYLYQAGLTTWLKQSVIPHMSLQNAPSLRHLSAAELGQWVLGLAALLIGIVILGQYEEMGSNCVNAGMSGRVCDHRKRGCFQDDRAAKNS